MSKNVNSGNSYEGKIVQLEKTLDFNEDSSYKNSKDTSYGDLNGDGTTEGIKAELTNKADCGFTPIGNDSKPFSGTFDGQENEIRNLYINTTNIYAGLFGYVENGKIENLGITGEVSSSSNTNESIYAGGIAGYITFSGIDNCYNIGQVSSSNNWGTGYYYSYSGGIVAYVSDGSSINNCYNTGEVSSSSNNTNGVSRAGGIAGNVLNIKISNCYNTGDISSSGGCVEDAGVIAGHASDISIINCYYLDTITIKGRKNSKGTSVSDDYMKTEEFVKRLKSSVWIKSDSGYPILDINNITYIENINCIEDLVKLSNDGDSYNGKTVKLNRTLDFSENSSYNNPTDTSYGDLNEDGTIEGIKAELTNKTGCGFTPIGNYFSGTFDGQGMEIRNLYVNTTNGYAGLVGYVRGGTLKNLVVTGTVSSSSNNNRSNKTTSFSYAGGIAGYIFDSKIIKCYSAENISSSSSNNDSYGSAESYTGGIAGYISNSSIINCHNTGNISGSSSVISDSQTCYIYAGGIAGYISNSSITNCSNVEGVDGISVSTNRELYAGGIAGYISNSSINNCCNKRDLSSSARMGYVGGIAGKASGNITNCYNIGDVSSSARMGYVGGIAGQQVLGNITNCYNTGDISKSGDYSNIAGGIVGDFNTSRSIINCYNTGDIISSSGSYKNMGGGIAGCLATSSSIKNCYNTGDVSSNGNSSKAGGIAGYIDSSRITNCYNTGEVSGSGSGHAYAGGIAGHVYSGRINNCYYLDVITITGNTINSYGTLISDTYMKSKEFYNKLNVDNVWSYRRTTYPVLLKQIPANLTESTELLIENTIKKFEITTDVTEVNGVKGGNITGEDLAPFETIIYGENSTKEIVMTPDSGYGISNITINGEKINYEINSNGTYSIPVGYFKNVQEDKHIVVTYTPLDQILLINKVDDTNSNEKLEGAKFKIEQIDQRLEVTNEMGNLTDNGKTYTKIDKQNEINNVLGSLTNNGNYFFT